VKVLRKIGLDYPQRTRRPEMQAIYRLIVAEAPWSPNLGQLPYDKGKGPYLMGLSDYLAVQHKAGVLKISDAHASHGNPDARFYVTHPS
jgi:hypothetical protein